MTAALDVAGLEKSFGAKVALQGVDLTVAPGELVALVGPSGCGKSTLLRIVAGLLPADAGRVDIAGQVVDDGARAVDPERRGVGLVFQEHALFPHLSVAANIGFGLRRMAGDDRRRRVERWLGVIGLTGHGRRYPHELSGGERQRVALARALAPAPRLLLLDEPFASLDPNLRTELRGEVVALLREAGAPAVFVTHDQVEALAVGDRVAVMRSGRFAQVATAEEVYTRPANRFVAAFMGEASFLPVGADGATELGPVSIIAPADRGCSMVVRPDEVGLTPAADGVAEVVAAEFRGPSRAYLVRLPSGTELRATQRLGRPLAAGTRVHVALSPGPHPVVPD